jgi:hypothetical protein
LLLCLAAGDASAHTVTVGQSKIEQEDGEVRYELAVEYHELMQQVGLADPSGGLPPPESPDAELTATLADREDALAEYLGTRIRVFLDGVGCEHALRSTDVVRFQGVVYAVASLAYECPGSPSGAYEIHYELLFDEASARHGLAHSNVADYELDGESGRFLFEPRNRVLAAGETSVWSSSWRFVLVGIEHILKGLDHVLFVLVLLLGASRLMSVVRVVGAFTVAHSLTLALASTGWVNVSPAIVEPLIALSIAYVAIENILRDEPKHRQLVVFGFGLIHGLGFASTLSFSDDVSWRFLSSLFAFNVGIEVGQLLIILSIGPLIFFARRLSKRQGAEPGDVTIRARWSRFALTGASGVVASLGFLWFFERLLAA